MGNLDIAYVLLRFPCLTETFVAEEIQKLLNKGVNICIYSLLPHKKELVHPVSKQLIPHVHYVPEVYQPKLWFSQLYFLWKSPRKYLQTLLKLLLQPSPRFSFRIKRLAIFLKSVWLAKELKEKGVPLVHTHFAWLSAAACFVVHELVDIPYTVTAHAYDIYSNKNDLLNLATKHASYVVTISENNKRAILGMLPTLGSENISVIRCGIDFEFFKAPMAESSDHLLRIISVGSLIEKKGHEYLIRACHELKEKGIDFECTIVGRGDLEQSLKQLIQHLGLVNSVQLVGSQSQTWVRDQLCRRDVFVLACVSAGNGGSDGIPVSIMEAMAMKVPVISTPVSGIPELIQHEKTGLLVPERDPASLANAILRLHHEKALRKTITGQGYSLVHKEYDITTNVCHLLSMFQDVMDKRMSTLSTFSEGLDRKKNWSPIIIGVAGGSGSGKSTVVKETVKQLDHNAVTVLAHDSYYRDRSHLPVEERSNINYDHPSALETSLLVSHLKELRAGRPVDIPIYDFATHTRRLEHQHIEPCKVIIVEGILILAEPDLRPLFDIKVFVDTDADIRFIRRMNRDITERSRTRESVVKQYLETVRPMHEQFVEPSKKYADVIIPEGGYNIIAVDMLLTKIRSVILDGNSVDDHPTLQILADKQETLP